MPAESFLNVARHRRLIAGNQLLDPVVSAVYEPGSVAKMFLASAASDFVNGQTLYVDGGILAVI